MTRLLPLILVAIAVASCGRQPSGEESPDGSAEQSVGSDTADPAMEETAECRNSGIGYSLRYPATWHVNSSEVLRPCSLFDPEPLDVPLNSEIPIEIAIMIDVESVAYSTLTGEVLGRRDISRERTTVDGREAMRIESETTGEGLYDRGIRMYQVFIQLGDSTMVASTFDAGSLPFERKRRILDAMIESVEFL